MNMLVIILLVIAGLLALIIIIGLLGKKEYRLEKNIFYGKSKFPMNLMHMFMDKMVGRDMQKNLDNLKNNLEK